MLEILRGKKWWITILLSLVISGCASTATKDETQKTVTAAEATLNNFKNDPEMKWFRENFKHAKAVLISPQILQAGFIVGGSTGKAVAMAHPDGGATWAGPAFYRISTGSLGLQAGAQSVEMVALIMSEKALSSLMSSSFKMGGDVSVSAGPVGAGTSIPITSDMVVFTRSKGLYGGLNLDGTAITTSDDENKAYYGKPVTPVDILAKRSVSSPSAAALSKTLSAVTP